MILLAAPFPCSSQTQIAPVTVDYQHTILAVKVVKYSDQTPCEGIEWKWLACLRNIKYRNGFNVCKVELQEGQTEEQIRKSLHHERIHCMGWDHDKYFYWLLEQLADAGPRAITDAEFKGEGEAQ